MAASAVGFRQFREIRFPAQVNHLSLPKILGRTPCCRTYSSQNCRCHRKEQAYEYNMTHRPMKPINAREHANPLLLTSKTMAGTGKTTSKQSLRRQLRLRS